MRASRLLHGPGPQVGQGGPPAPGAADPSGLERAGYLVRLGPGLLAGSALLQRVLARLEARLRELLLSQGGEELALPVSEDHAVVNVLAQVGRLAGPGSTLAFAIGAGFREQAPSGGGLAEAQLYRRLDLAWATSHGEETLRTLKEALLRVVRELGLVQVAARPSAGSTVSAAPVPGAGPDVHRELVLLATLPEETPGGDADTLSLGSITLRELGQGPGGARRLVTARLDLFALLEAAARQGRDARGLCWPAALAPFEVVLIPAADEGGEGLRAAEKLLGSLEQAGLSVLLDDRPLPPAVKRADAEGWGLPARVLCGPSAARQVVVEQRDAEGPPARVATGELAGLLLALLGRGADAPRASLRRALF